MNHRRIVWSAAALADAVGLFLSAGQASAHVVYGNSLYADTSVVDPVRTAVAQFAQNAIDPTVIVAGVNGAGSVNGIQDRFVSSNAGWVGGLDPVGGMDSHRNRFMYFNLGSEAIIDFTITGTNLPNGTANGGVSAGVLNPGYSLFSGVAPHLSHDGSPYAGQPAFSTWSPFNGAAAGNTGVRFGSYNSNAAFTMANDQGTVSTVNFLNSDSSATNVVTGQYTLGPGVYSLVVGGANGADLAAMLSNAQASESCDIVGAACDVYNINKLSRSFNIVFNVTPVPLPAAVWLFGSGVVGVIAFARRRMSA